MWQPLRSVYLRQELVKRLRAEQAIRSREVEETFLVIPREYFLPDTPLEHVYQDVAIVVKRVEGEPRSSSSQPALMADMLEVLELGPGQHVLEIGAGTGYNAALLARMVGNPGSIVSVDIDPDMVAAARTHLARAGFAPVHVVLGDGAAGYPPRAPYDRIIVTVQQHDLSPAWAEQLRHGGILLVPLTIYEPLRLSLIPAFRKEGGRLVARCGSMGGFMPMQGELAHPRIPEPVVPLTPGPSEDGLLLMTESPRVRALFQPAGDGRSGPGRLRPIAREPTRTSFSMQQQGGLALLLAMEMGNRSFRLRSGHERFGFKGLALGLLGATGRGATVITGSELLHYADTEAAAEARGLLARWRALGRPCQRDFPVVALPREREPFPVQPGWVVERPNYRFVIGLPERGDG